MLKVYFLPKTCFASKNCTNHIKSVFLQKKFWQFFKVNDMHIVQISAKLKKVVDTPYNLSKKNHILYIRGHFTYFGGKKMRLAKKMSKILKTVFTK